MSIQWNWTQDCFELSDPDLRVKACWIELGERFDEFDGAVSDAGLDAAFPLRIAAVIDAVAAAELVQQQKQQRPAVVDGSLQHSHLLTQRRIAQQR